MSDQVSEPQSRQQRSRHRGNGRGSLIRRDPQGPWIARFFNHQGKRRELTTGTTDKQAAERMLVGWLNEVALRKRGLIDPAQEALIEQKRSPLDDQIDAFVRHLKTKGCTPGHTDRTEKYIRAAGEFCGWMTIGDITKDGLYRFAADLKDKRRSARNIQANMQAVCRFTRWLAKTDKLPFNPLDEVDKPDPEGDRRRFRRYLTHEEWEWMRSVVPTTGERFGMSAQERLLLYATAIQTGLRSAELRALSRGRLFLKMDPPFITCPARSCKNRDDARQYVKPDLAQALTEHVATKAPKVPVFSMPRGWEVAEMLRADVADTRKAWLDAAKHDPEEYEKRQQSDFLAETNHEGERLDSHGLRHSTGVWLAMSGAPAKAIQAVMRHSTITLTMDTYGHLLRGQEAATVAMLPSMMGDHPEEIQATGTDDATADTSNRPTSAPTSRPTSSNANKPRPDASQCDAPHHTPLKVADDNCVSQGTLRNEMRDDASKNPNTPGRTRTCDRGIRNPVLYPTELRAQTL
jgi:integrase